MKAWVIADHRPGNVTQIIGVAQSLRIPFDIKRIDYNAFAHLPNCILRSSDIGIDQNSKNDLSAPYPDLVIAAGRRTAPIALNIKKRAIKEKKTPPKLIQIMNPGNLQKHFDLIAVPKHDQMTANHNIFETLTAPHKVTKKALKEEKKKWDDLLQNTPSPRIGVLIGGKNKSNDISPEQTQELLSLTEKLAQQNNASLLLTTSRRTSETATNLVRNFLEQTNIPNISHLWHQDGGENPYFGFLASSDMFVITGDSVSMISEASITGKPIFIYAPQQSCSKSHRRLHSSLYETSVARPLEDEDFNIWSYKAPDAAAEIAREIKKRFLK